MDVWNCEDFKLSSSFDRLKGTNDQGRTPFGSVQELNGRFIQNLNVQLFSLVQGCLKKFKVAHSKRRLPDETITSPNRSVLPDMIEIIVFQYLSRSG